MPPAFVAEATFFHIPRRKRLMICSLLLGAITFHLLSQVCVPKRLLYTHTQLILTPSPSRSSP